MINDWDLSQIVGEINARTLFPVHTVHPEIYLKNFENVIAVTETKKHFVTQKCITLRLTQSY